MQILDTSFLKRLEQIEILSKKFLVKPGGLRWTGHYSGSSLEFSDFRPYTAGDDLKNVDWNIYRRLGEVVVKQFESEACLHLILAIDTSASMSYGDKFDYALKLCASLGYIGLSHMDLVSVLPYPRTEYSTVKSMCGKKKGHELFRYLENLVPKGNTDMYESLRKSLPRLPKHGACVVISDFYDRDYEKSIRLLHFKGFEITCLHLISPEDRNPFLKGSLILKDVESLLEVEMDVTPGLIEKYRKAFDRRISQLESFCLEHKTLYIRVDTDTPLERTVLTLLRKARLLK